jgi:hypothetical protein
MSPVNRVVVAIHRGSNLLSFGPKEILFFFFLPNLYSSCYSRATGQILFSSLTKTSLREGLLV